ncbi:ABC transporter ATP-binding protein [Devosia psychrophila]|uniref:ABC transporter ATP-binding protein n=1 Tax=Devosia psychrophila TaxID=728005 RepID=A0A0F5PRZ6_9HYPH|nr:sugar ABC transporter ATP-binding protein [Devosia psychrophila]KKC31428.1 ABC transporter ATP-binding protein [Devosia psychrophila]SFC94447.1 monosaccharide ABC transporter ATP-binding protein, CUT2 family [Devosia psychrophila]
MTGVSDQTLSGPTNHPGAPQALPVLSVSNISKTFGGAKALQNVSFKVMPGEVHGLLGKNGSGKSTLVKILAGFHAPDDGGTMQFNGDAVSLPLKPGDYRRLGMAFVHQNLGLIPSLTVLENLRLVPLTSGKALYIDWSTQDRAARQALSRFSLDLDPNERVDRLTPVQRALLAIVRAFEEIEASRAITGRPGLVLLDEPTPFLPAAGVEQLFSMVRSITQSGSSVIFISHDIDEVMEITDSITVLRDGEMAGALTRDEASHEAIVKMIVGRNLFKTARPAGGPVERPVFARISGLSGKMLQKSDLHVGKGEILGLTGLIGSGYGEVPYLVFGAHPARSGTITVDGGAELAQTALSPRAAIDMGFALLPGDRQGASGVDSLPIVDNLFLPDVSRFFKGGFMRNRAMVREAKSLGAAFEVRPNDPGLKLSALSGGNAQKVLIARWMNRSPLLLLLDEPTQGVDVGTRQQIFAALRAAAAKGMSVICASSEAEQLAEICDRVLVFSKGSICTELVGDALTKEGISEACYATAAPASTSPLTSRVAP